MTATPDVRTPREKFEAEKALIETGHPPNHVGMGIMVNAWTEESDPDAAKKMLEYLFAKARDRIFSNTLSRRLARLRFDEAHVMAFLRAAIDLADDSDIDLADDSDVAIRARYRDLAIMVAEVWKEHLSPDEILKLLETRRFLESVPVQVDAQLDPDALIQRG